jgi:LmbE family N-acetylglucosaminyl deacetylase
LGSLLVIAPHPDDETLGCGGLIARARQLGQTVSVVFVTDGGRSHPGSRLFCPARLAATRRSEALDALRALAVREDHVLFLGLPDGAVPSPGDPRFPTAVERVREALGRFGPNTVLRPWRRDPHADHRAVWRLVAGALERAAPCRVLDYIVWLEETGQAEDWPRSGEATGLRVEIADVVETKNRALLAHRSQLGLVVPDDPAGFALPDTMLARARRPFELFLAASA